MGLGATGRNATLPVMLTAMLGRGREVARLRSLMRDPAVRMVTITGPGGVGKTRLAIGAAADADDDLEIVFVSLAAVREPERVVPAIGRAIGLNLEPRAEGEEALVRTLAARTTVLVLDNREQIPGIAPVVDRLVARE